MDEKRNFDSLPIVIKEELDSDSEEVYCRLCLKAFANPIALQNHARMDHTQAFQNGDPSVWTKVKTEPVVSPKLKFTKTDQKLFVQKREQEILSSMGPTQLTSLASDNVSFIIVKSDDPLLAATGNKPVRKDKDGKKVMPKKQKTEQVIPGPFECLESSPLGADGVCHQMFFSCCDYSLHACNEHGRRRRAPRCQVCERPLQRQSQQAGEHCCETCGEGFSTKEEMNEHVKKFHVKARPYECGICQKRFTQQGGVLQHMRMHTGDRPFPCTFCNKAFTQKSGLDQHLRTHTKQKPYKCVVCTKAFIQSVHLKQHMRTHTNVTPFQCAICGKRFKQTSHLNYHIKNHNPSNMTSEQREKYAELLGLNTTEQEEEESGQVEEVEIKEGFVEVEIENPESVVEEVLVEQTLTEGDTYIIGDNYEELPY